jgi:hypothetical protein
MTDTIRRDAPTELMLHSPPGALLGPEPQTSPSWRPYFAREVLLAGCAVFLLGFLLGTAGVVGWDLLTGGLR